MLERLRKILERKETRERLDKIERQIEELDREVQSQGENIQEVEHRAERNAKGIAQIKSELDESEQTPAEWTSAETEVLAILFDAESPLTNKEIGKRLEPEKDGDKIRPIIHRIKQKIDLMEEKRGRAKAYKLPKSIKTEYLENQNLKLSNK